MLRPFFTIIISFCVFNPVFGQVNEEINTDSVQILESVVVEAYAYQKPIIDVPAAVAFVEKKDLRRYNDVSLLPAINTIPGVRMEERSPGSYRLSIRGSTLRSPFGIRNVKVYWNDLPFTDPGGNTYLNLIDVSTLGQVEVIKGPGSSLYGAGTGGVLLLKPSTAKFNDREAYFSSVVGSYGLARIAFGVENHTNKSNAGFHYAHQESSGYRDQSAMRRDVIQAEGKYQLDSKRTISAKFLYVDLNYETPGALTLTEFKENPKQSRPASGPNASAAEQKAAVFNKTIYAGVGQEYDINLKWSNKTGAYLTFTQFENPAIRNYERRAEQSFGARSVTQYKSNNVSVTFGGEFQHGFSPIKTYSNAGGKIDTLQTDTEISSTTGLAFLQADVTLPLDFSVTLGGSLNFNAIKFDDFSSSQGVSEIKKFSPVLSPRIALLKKISNSISTYASVSQGFSPPTIAELYPSFAVFNKQLKAEQGFNYEIGIRGKLIKYFSFDAVGYIFQLKNAITIRRSADGGEYFVNAGNTLQKGIEVSLAYQPALSATNFVTGLKVWTAATINDYTFQEYIKGNNDYSGNKLTGVSPNVVTLAGDLMMLQNFYINATGSFTDRIPLDDANTTYSNQYLLIGGRIGWRPVFKRLSADFFFAVDNALDKHYSLGNDINAQAQRFYNAAPTRNFSAGLKLSFMKTKQ